MRKRLLNLLQIILVCSNCNKCDQRVSYCKKFFLLNYQRRAVCINTAQHKGQWTKISRGGSIDRPDKRLATAGMIWTTEEILWKPWYWSTIILLSKRSAIFLTIMKQIYIVSFCYLLLPVLIFVAIFIKGFVQVAFEMKKFASSSSYTFVFLCVMPRLFVAGKFLSIYWISINYL